MCILLKLNYAKFGVSDLFFQKLLKKHIWGSTRPPPPPPLSKGRVNIQRSACAFIFLIELQSYNSLAYLEPANINTSSPTFRKHQSSGSLLNFILKLVTFVKSKAVITIYQPIAKRKFEFLHQKHSSYSTDNFMSIWCFHGT